MTKSNLAKLYKLLAPRIRVAVVCEIIARAPKQHHGELMDAVEKFCGATWLWIAGEPIVLDDYYQDFVRLHEAFVEIGQDEISVAVFLGAHTILWEVYEAAKVLEGLSFQDCPCEAREGDPGLWSDFERAIVDARQFFPEGLERAVADVVSEHGANAADLGPATSKGALSFDSPMG